MYAAYINTLSDCIERSDFKLWDELNDELKMCTSHVCFKTSLKSKIIKGYEVI